MMVQGKGITAKRRAGFCFRAVHHSGMAATGRDVRCGSRSYGDGGKGLAPLSLYETRWRCPTQVDDLSRSLIAFEQNSTMVVVLEMSQSSWLAAGVVPGIERRPLKKLDPDPTALLRLVEGWRYHAMKVGRMITRIVLAFEAESF